MSDDDEFELHPWWLHRLFDGIAIVVVLLAAWGLVDGCVHLLRSLPYAQ